MRSPHASGEDPRALLVDVALPVPLDQSFTYVWRPGEPGGAPERGDLVGVPFGRRRELVGLVVATRPCPAPEPLAGGHALRPVGRRLPAAYRLGPDRLRLAEWMAGYYALPLGEVVPLFHPPGAGTRHRAPRRPAAPFPLPEGAEPIVPTSAQTAAVTAATGLLAAGEFGVVLLHGVTGSGKTEVYLQVIGEALARGRGALFLLPEIALTPQTLARIAARFGAAAAAVHSGLAAGERSRVHEAAASGDVRLVVGPRSALFAPVRDLGVVIVDEEHETSYKQEEKPRYHARHAALVRAREAGAVVLLGSATPDLESWDNGRRGRYRLHTLPERPVGELPPVEMVDMRGTPAPEGFSPALLAALETTLAAGRQAILYYNRRGFARSLQCAACGVADPCPRCDIGLVYHLRPRRLLCHYCGFSRPAPDACPHCGGRDFVPAGGGTERLELSLGAAFPGARVLRLDQDSTRRRDSHGRILGAFAAGKADILVGTQMVVKGHHFPAVGLVGVLAADDGLTLPDYRADERAFQLLTQVAGRTGRTGQGRVLFQTWCPEHPILRLAAAHDYETFAARELAAREALGYPPARRLLRLAVSAPGASVAQAAAGALAAAVAAGLPEGECEVLGPAPAVFARLQDRFRWQILVKGTPSAAQKRWLAACGRAAAARGRGVEVLLDVDPVGLY